MKHILEENTVIVHSEKDVSYPAQEVSWQNDLDPLDGVGHHNPEEIFFKLDATVFAEPLESKKESKHPDYGAQNEECFKFFDNVTVENRCGKRKKYHIPISSASEPVCPKTNCNKTFSTIRLLKAHIRKVHCAEQRYTCEVCGSSFTAKYLLMRHMAVHEAAKIECPVCFKKLSKRTNLSVHLRTHTDTRTHTCAECGKAFVRKSTLRTHVKFVHSKEISCDKCGLRTLCKSIWGSTTLYPIPTVKQPGCVSVRRDMEPV